MEDHFPLNQSPSWPAASPSPHRLLKCSAIMERSFYFQSISIMASSLSITPPVVEMLRHNGRPFSFQSISIMACSLSITPPIDKILRHNGRPFSSQSISIMASSLSITPPVVEMLRHHGKTFLLSINLHHGQQPLYLTTGC